MPWALLAAVPRASSSTTVSISHWGWALREFISVRSRCRWPRSFAGETPSRRAAASWWELPAIRSPQRSKPNAMALTTFSSGLCSTRPRSASSARRRGSTASAKSAAPCASSFSPSAASPSRTLRIASAPAPPASPPSAYFRNRPTSPQQCHDFVLVLKQSFGGYWEYLKMASINSS